MKIIDAHIHYRPDEGYFDKIALDAGHENSEKHLCEAFGTLNIERAVVMGNRDLSLEDHVYPDFLSYCIGLDQGIVTPDTLDESVALVEKHLQRPSCAGIKIYAGYTRMQLTDPAFIPFYELAQHYQKPVAVHTGVTASPNALLKYSHPLRLDEAAVSFPRVQFVMCHFGNPWLMDAAAVLEKNENVCADLSGLLVGSVDIPTYMREQAGYVEQLKTWIAYVEDYNKFLYGTDWPLVNMGAYADFIARLIPERFHEKVFYENARRVYGLADI